MTRREFLATVGAGAAFVACGGITHADQIPQPPLDVELLPGDVITIEGRYAVNPKTRESTGHLQQFVVVSVDAGRTSVILHPKVESYCSWPKNVRWRK